MLSIDLSMRYHAICMCMAVLLLASLSAAAPAYARRDLVPDLPSVEINLEVLDQLAGYNPAPFERPLNSYKPSKPPSPASRYANAPRTKPLPPTPSYTPRPVAKPAMPDEDAPSTYARVAPEGESLSRQERRKLRNSMVNKPKPVDVAVVKEKPKVTKPRELMKEAPVVAKKPEEPQPEPVELAKLEAPAAKKTTPEDLPELPDFAAPPEDIAPAPAPSPLPPVVMEDMQMEAFPPLPAPNATPFPGMPGEEDMAALPELPGLEPMPEPAAFEPAPASPTPVLKEQFKGFIGDEAADAPPELPTVDGLPPLDPLIGDEGDVMDEGVMAQELPALPGLVDEPPAPPVQVTYEEPDLPAALPELPDFAAADEAPPPAPVPEPEPQIATEPPAMVLPDMPALPDEPLPEEMDLASLPPEMEAMPEFAPPPEPEPVPMPVPVSAAKPAPAPQASAGGDGPNLRIEFEPTETEVPLVMQERLNSLVEQIKGAGGSVVIRAYAAGSPEQASIARRVSLSRALAVRAYLIEKGVPPLSINPQALGSNNAGGPAERADIFVN